MENNDSINRLKSNLNVPSLTVDARTTVLEKSLQSIQEKIENFDAIFQGFPIVCSKLDTCILNVDVILKNTSDGRRSLDQVFRRHPYDFYTTLHDSMCYWYL